MCGRSPGTRICCRLIKIGFAWSQKEITSPMPILNQLNIVAKDFDKTLDFYRRVGVDVPDGVHLPDGTRHTSITLSNGVVFEVDNQALARLYNAGWRRPEGSSPAVIGFSFTDFSFIRKVLCFGGR
jgi:hypothetical protein